MAGVGETVVREAHKRGVLLVVGPDGTLWYFPKERVHDQFRRFLNKFWREAAHWLVTDSVTIE